MAPAGEGLPVVAEERHRPGEDAAAAVDARRPTGSRPRRRRGSRSCSAKSPLAGSVSFDDDRDVDVAVLPVDVALERVDHAVGHEARGGEERDAGDDRDQGRDVAADVVTDAADGEMEHGDQPSNCFMRSSTRSVVGFGISSMIWPSARKSTLSAYDAACGSWVTITIVWPDVVDGAAHEGEDLDPGAGVEGAGRLVGEDDLRAGHERPRDRDALLLATGELAGQVAEPVAEPDRRDDLVEPGLVRRRVPASVSGRTMFSAAVSVGIRLYCWKMKPRRSRRSSVSSVLFRLPTARSRR